jgi:hypothetical protein
VTATELEREDSKRRFSLPTLKLGVVGLDGSINVVRRSGRRRRLQECRARGGAFEILA